LLAEAEVRRIGAGEWVYGTGDTPRGVFALLGGAALVYVALPRGDDVLVQIAMPGDVFGHAAQLGHGPRLATVLTARPSTLMYLPESALTRLGRRHPELWASLTQLLYNQYGALLLQFARHLALPARARLAGRLLQLTDFTPAPPVAALPQAQLAELVGVTRKTINALLAELAREGLVNVRRRQVAILQRDALRRIAVGEPA
jgi:CRP-like cAMP-binding protein